MSIKALNLFDQIDLEAEVQARRQANKIIPRPFQRDAVNAAYREWQSVQSTLVSAPTGTGKSVIFTEVMRRWPEWSRAKGRQVLIGVHREELLIQAVAHAQNAGLTVGIEMGNRRARGNEDVIVSTIQTLNAKRKCRTCHGAGCKSCRQRGSVKRMERFDPADFGLVVVDEGHHATAKSYRVVLNWFKRNRDLKILLVTATPKRADGDGLHNVCDSVAYEMDLRTAINEGWLCPIRQMLVALKWLDISKVTTKAGGDLADGELEQVFLGHTSEEEQKQLHAVAFPCLQEAGGRSVLVFAAGRAHAEKLTAAFNAYDGVTAELVLGTTDRTERPHIIERYKNGTTQVLVGCGVFTEGFDAPNTAVCAIARPTKSEPLYLQMIGRATRPAPGVVDGPETAAERRTAIAASSKPHCTIIDFTGNAGRHKLVTVADVLAGKDVDPVDLDAALDEAKKLSAPVDMDELIEKAKQARQERENARDKRRRQRLVTTHRAEKGEYTTEDVDVFAGRRFNPFTDYHPPSPHAATVKQVAFLAKLGVPPENATKLSKRKASAKIDELTNRSGGDFIVTLKQHAGKPLRDVPAAYLDWAISVGAGGEKLRENVELMREQQTEEIPVTAAAQW